MRSVSFLRTTSTLVSVALSLPATAQEDAVRLVNPFVGTDAHGHTFPGATVPFGMVQLSPDTRVEGWDACAGYHYSDRSILGFSHTHLSGTGVGDYGDVLFAPMTGAVLLDTGTVERPGYRSHFRHATERAWPGYYAVDLEPRGIRAELTATTRTGVHRYTYPRTDSAWMVIDLVHGIGPDVVIEAALAAEGTTVISGFRRSRGWAADQIVYFVAEFSRPFVSAGFSEDSLYREGGGSLRGRRVRGAVRFDLRDGRPLVVRVGLSSVGVEGARANLRAEMPDWDFDRARSEAEETWRRALSRVTVRGGTLAERRTFATALYRTMIAPNVFSDTDGRYRTMSGTVGHARGFTRYTVFSLWDTFRAAHPLFTILEPGRTADFVNSFLSIFDEGGVLPVWELAANETWCMIGYHSVSVILDAHAKGIGGFDPGRALRAMVASANKDHFGMRACRLHAYVPAEQESESVSKTLEYAYDDWCIARMAELTGDSATAREFAVRAESYRNLFDPSTGFMRAKSNGAWKEPFRPRAVTVDYTEANAWQYAFFAPHNVAGLMSLYGGADRFAQRLDEMFAAGEELEGRNQADITGLIGQYAHGNEPSHHVAYLYAYAGRPERTQELVRRIRTELYSDAPDGLIGNEDCGQMSAWYIFSALGFYPVNPGQPLYVLGIPGFPEADIALPRGRTFSVRTVGSPPATGFVSRVILNGKELDRSWITHEEVMAGGQLTFVLAPAPSATWGRGSTVPPSPPSTPIVLTPLASTGVRSFEDTLVVALSCGTEGASVHLTLDGTDPTPASPRYEGPITIRSSTVVQARAFAPGLPPSGLMRAEYMHARRAGSVVRISEFSPQYTAGGEQAIVDGVRGVTDFRVGGWQGFEENDLEAVIDLQAPRDISRIRATFLHDNNAWIFAPQEVTIEVSPDGTGYTRVKQAGPLLAAETAGAIICETLYEGSTEGRYIRIRARNIGRCPSWHKGSGNKAWLFVDEVEIR